MLCKERLCCKGRYALLPNRSDVEDHDAALHYWNNEFAFWYVAWFSEFGPAQRNGDQASDVG